MAAESWREVAAVSGMVLGISAAAFNAYGAMVLRARDREDFVQLRDAFEEYRGLVAGQLADLRVAIARLERNGGGKP